MYKLIMLIILSLFFYGCEKYDNESVELDGIKYSISINGQCFENPLIVDEKSMHDPNIPDVVVRYIESRNTLKNGSKQDYINEWHPSEHDRLENLFSDNERFESARRQARNADEPYTVYCVASLGGIKYMFYSIKSDEKKVFLHALFKNEGGRYLLFNPIQAPVIEDYANADHYLEDRKNYGRQVFYINMVQSYINLKYFGLFEASHEWMTKEPYWSQMHRNKIQAQQP